MFKIGKFTINTKKEVEAARKAAEAEKQAQLLKAQKVESLKTGALGFGKDILTQTISSLLIIGAVNGFQYMIDKQLEKKAAEKAASSQE